MAKVRLTWVGGPVETRGTVPSIGDVSAGVQVIHHDGGSQSGQGGKAGTLFLGRSGQIQFPAALKELVDHRGHHFFARSSPRCNGCDQKTPIPADEILCTEGFSETVGVMVKDPIEIVVISPKSLVLEI